MLIEDFPKYLRELEKRDMRSREIINFLLKSKENNHQNRRHCILFSVQKYLSETPKKPASVSQHSDKSTRVAEDTIDVFSIVLP